MHNIDATLAIPKIMKDWYHPTSIVNTPIEYNSNVGTDFIIDTHNRLGTLPANYYDLVLGCGSTQLLNAYIRWVISREGEAIVYAHRPHYGRLTQIVKFIPEARLTDNPQEANVEYLIILGNPDGKYHLPYTNAKYVFFDGAYFWPQYTKDDSELRSHFNQLQFGKYDMLTYTMSKSIGLAGVRLGYGFTFCRELTEWIFEYKETHTITVPDMLSLCKMLYDEIEDIIYPLRNELQYRLAAIKDLLPKSRFKVLNNQGGVAWIRGDKSELEKVGIKVLPGTKFRQSGNYFRINLLITNSEFDELTFRLKNLIK